MNIYKKYLSISFILIYSCFTYSQERLLKGKVYFFDTSSEESVADIYVKNINTGYTTITDLTGNFVIPAQAEDKIQFTSYHTEERIVTVTPTMYEEKKMRIQLDISTGTVLESVTVVGLKSYGSLELDVKRIPMKNKTNELMNKLGELMPTQKMDGSTDLDSQLARLAPMKFSIDNMLGALSGETKKKEKLYIYEDRMNVLQDIRDYLGDQYFIDQGLNKDQINEFLLFTYLNYNLRYFYDHQNYYVILSIFNKSIENYKSKKNESK
ncbi:hypothetical protein ETU10_09885 [Apibacter muscae]|uniref:Carboxypeptidase-like regulatory domain-containing protein n=1 Tax=Apibacter muscae TaxID=2509004 RepID=A0A563D8V0_9FLAO|nr:carboxypeptidase-like regulatory domain-containing protein [Apibacter muscae]TWP22893.1 hypothetical protein ETU10_09885 [Apibacter muscae]TWP26224.1 hypothetical protein ETU09_11030 [Apibacter muscae]